MEYKEMIQKEQKSLLHDLMKPDSIENHQSSIAKEKGEKKEKYRSHHF